jgi:hypothetical protein
MCLVFSYTLFLYFPQVNKTRFQFKKRLEVLSEVLFLPFYFEV